MLGSIVTKKKGVLKDVCKGAWVVEAQALQRECGKLKEYFESRPKQDTANIFSSSIESSKSLTDNIFILFDEFSKNIDELEKKYN
ncbi:hypothetical protein Q4506_05375 [Colwellia sp. 4_MG-2023]|uniref:hypothetical protein n=1 Tax=unclassified Colwellia TaxID=196834 RepID=UPI0026E1DA65|nr:MULTISPECIES: hypothetical protein [unclassified Colwellia]MDO6506613.1 hypothetical protein [Colwellia sp. 5_MG-2023]MDO6555100.1 hypothetical protein [Colwellia sp. 4_MG-2023]